MDRLAEVCERIASTAMVARKSALLAEFLGSLAADDASRARKLLGDGPPLKLSATTIRQACRALLSWDDAVLRMCYEQSGDTMEAVSLLVAPESKADPMTLEVAEQLYLDLFLAKTTAAKAQIVKRLLATYKPLTVKWYLRAITGKLGLKMDDTPVVVPIVVSNHSLSLAITSAEPGRGQFATLLSEYTIGVKSGDGFVNLGKATAELPEKEIRELTRLLRKATLERFGKTSLVAPQIVVEVAFERVERNPRRKGGLALIGPRVVVWHREKLVSQIADLSQVEALLDAYPAQDLAGTSLEESGVSPHSLESPGSD